VNIPAEFSDVGDFFYVVKLYLLNLHCQRESRFERLPALFRHASCSSRSSPQASGCRPKCIPVQRPGTSSQSCQFCTAALPAKLKLFIVGDVNCINLQLLSATMYASCRQAAQISSFSSYQSYLLHRPVPTKKLSNLLQFSPLTRDFYTISPCQLELEMSFAPFLRHPETKIRILLTNNNKWHQKSYSDGVRSTSAKICQETKTQVFHVVECFIVRRQ
jgi:hypothetical protein